MGWFIILIPHTVHCGYFGNILKDVFHLDPCKCNNKLNKLTKVIAGYNRIIFFENIGFVFENICEMFLDFTLSGSFLVAVSQFLLSFAEPGMIWSI